MLSVLTVKNLAIIDHITIEFNDGLTILTGETGAGKSLIIDAINLLLGERAPSGLIRTGESKAIIEGIFTKCGSKVNELLQGFGIDDEEDLIIRREILDTGKSYIRLNGMAVSLSQVEELSKYLVDIHTQGESKKLFNRSNYVDLVDDIDAKDILKNYQCKLNVYKESIKKYQNLKEKASVEQKEYDYLKFCYEELQKASLREDEIFDIEEELNYLNNFDQIFKNLSYIKNVFQTNNIIETLYDVKNQITKLIPYANDLSKFQSIIDNCYYELDDFEKVIIDKLNNLDYNTERVDDLNARLSFINTLKRKYGLDVKTLIDYRDNLKIRLNECENYDFLLVEYENNVKTVFGELIEIAQNLSNFRRHKAEILTNNIKATLNDLCLPKVQMEMVFNEVDFCDPFNSQIFKNNGVDLVDIKISFNPGESLKSLAKVASGGEMSRVMLALKTHLLTKSTISTMIFDEIDTGVSGEVAMAMANKLKMISDNVQVLAITHLPIVACAADQHIHITKQSSSLQTNTTIKELDYSERVKEIAKMITSNEDDFASIQLAVSMIDSFVKK